MIYLLTYFLILFVFGISSDALKPDCKNYKQTTYDSIVCVCSEAEPCDKIEAPVRTAPNVITRWESSRDGARLRKQTIFFDKNIIKGSIIVKPISLYVKVNRHVKYQTIFGFGGAFTDATGIGVNRMSSELGQKILMDYFSKDGLEYNVGRIPIGGSDFSARAYSYDDHGGVDRTLNKFNLTEEDFHFKIPLIHKAKSMATHEIRLIGSPWSAPAWMKTNDKLHHGGTIKGPVGSELWQLYAKYFVRYLNNYKAQNITHWGITIQNEPFVNQSFNSMLYTPEMMRDFLATTLGPELELSGWGTDKLIVMIWDHNLDHVQEWVRVVFADPIASKYAAGTAVHWYSHTPQTVLDEAHRLHPDKFILSTEACAGPGVKLGDWNLAEQYAEDILQDLLHHVIGWIDWNMVLDMQGGPNWVGNFNDAPIIVDPDNHQYYRQPSFYAMAHFSKFLAPGSVRIDTTFIQQNNKAIVGAFRTPYNSTVVIVLNNHNETVHLTLDDSEAGVFTAIVEPRSIQTYVYYD